MTDSDRKRRLRIIMEEEVQEQQSSWPEPVQPIAEPVMEPVEGMLR